MFVVYEAVYDGSVAICCLLTCVLFVQLLLMVVKHYCNTSGSILDQHLYKELFNLLMF